MINSGSKINAINFAYAANLEFRVQKTDIDAQKNDYSSKQTYNMIITNFQIFDKLSYLQLFHKTFLLLDMKIKVFLDMLFLTLSNADVKFNKKKLTYRT